MPVFFTSNVLLIASSLGMSVTDSVLTFVFVVIARQDLETIAFLEKPLRLGERWLDLHQALSSKYYVSCSYYE